MSEKSFVTLKRAVVMLMLLTMGAMLVNKSLYTHVHVMPDGTLEAHAHPFSRSGESSPDSRHTHSSLDYYFLQDLNTLFLMTLAGLILLYAGSRHIRKPLKIPYLAEGYIPVLPGSAPPSFM
jgi:hypothetical protein